MGSIKTSRAVNELFDTFLSVPMIARISASALYTGIVVVIVIVLIAAFVYRDSDDLVQKSIRIAFWGAIFTGMLLALRDRRMRGIIAEEYESDSTKELFTGPGSTTLVDESPLLTRANTYASQSSSPLITNEQLAAVAQRRGFVLVPTVPPAAVAPPAPLPPPVPQVFV